MKNEWVFDLIYGAMEIWRNSVATIFSFLSTSPMDAGGGSLAATLSSMQRDVTNIAAPLLIVFFGIGIISSASSFREFRRIENIAAYILRFAFAQVALLHSFEIMDVIFKIVSGILAMVTKPDLLFDPQPIPEALIQGMQNVDILSAVFCWLIGVIGALIMVINSFVLLLTVYGRIYKLLIYTVLSPLAMASFSGKPTEFIGKTFIKSYAGVCLQGVIIALICILFSAMSGMTAGIFGLEITADKPVVGMMLYIASTVFSMLVLVATVKGSDHMVKEMFGL